MLFGAVEPFSTVLSLDRSVDEVVEHPEELPSMSGIEWSVLLVGDSLVSVGCDAASLPTTFSSPDGISNSPLSEYTGGCKSKIGKEIGEPQGSVGTVSDDWLRKFLLESVAKCSSPLLTIFLKF